jgi:putative transposase
MPLGGAVEGANRHDCKRVQATLASQVLERPNPDWVWQHLCLDQGFDYDFVRILVRCWGYTTHIRSRGEETQEKAQIPGCRARRWVVERTHS